MKEKVLITGASGFVGFHLIEAALAKDLEVYAAIRRSSNIKHLEKLPLRFTYLDFNSVEALENDVRTNGYHYIIHAAGTTKAKNKEEYSHINATYTSNLAKAIVKSGVEVKKFVFISSLAAIGPETINELIGETKKPEPVTTYGISKLQAEEILEFLAFPTVVLRPTAVYGPRDKDIFIVLKTFYKGIEPYIGKQRQKLSFVYVKDLAQVSVEALFRGDDANGSYNITDGNCYDRYELANVTKKVLGKKTIKFHVPVPIVKALALILERVYGFMKKSPALNLEKLNELTAANWCCNIDKARQQLSFKPEYDLNKGLKETLEWYKQNQWF